MKSLILCCVLVSYFVMGLCDARECFRQTFEKISCSQAVRANTVIETQSEQPVSIYDRSLKYFIHKILISEPLKFYLRSQTKKFN